MISVVICTYNPRMDYLGRTLTALRQQTLTADKWELLIVDNASEKPLTDVLDLSWHPRARIVSESRLGLTNARIAGIGHAEQPWICFVDDDNLLAADFLETACRLAREHVSLGAFGGSSIGVFETEPPAWSRGQLGMLAVRTVEKEQISSPKMRNVYPFGAGLFIRTDVAKIYVSEVSSDPVRRNLGRKGTSLFSGEDTDMIEVAYRMGCEVALFPALRLEHLIPAGRLTLDYFVRLKESMSESGVLLAVSGGARKKVPLKWYPIVLFMRYLASWFIRRKPERFLLQACLRGIRRGVERVYAD